MNVITYACWNWSSTMLVKGPQEERFQPVPSECWEKMNNANIFSTWKKGFVFCVYFYQWHMLHTAPVYLRKIPLSWWHYSDVIMSMMVSQVTSISIVCSTICSGTGQRKHQSSTSLAFVRGIHRWSVDYPHKGPIMWKMFPFDEAYKNECFFIIFGHLLVT